MFERIDKGIELLPLKCRDPVVKSIKEVSLSSSRPWINFIFRLNRNHNINKYSRKSLNFKLCPRPNVMSFIDETIAYYKPYGDINQVLISIFLFL